MKKGFTVVELLASIVIMGLIIVISIPAYNGISKIIKENNYNSKITMITKSSSRYINKYHKDLVFNDDKKRTICYTIKYLITKNVFESDVKNGIGITDPLHGGKLDGYVVATYDLNDYEVDIEYKEKNTVECNSIKN